MCRILISLSVLLLTGCQSISPNTSREISNIKAPIYKYKIKSYAWCQKKVLSADISARQRQQNQIDCDTQYRRQYLLSKKNAAEQK